MEEHLSKEELLTNVLTAIEQAGWNISLLSSMSSHPLRVKISNNEEIENLLIYIWNISHGGKTRNPDEFRIQITGVTTLDFEKDYKTLLLGRTSIDGKEVFAAFNPVKHNTFGFSPSLQVKREKLAEAIEYGVAFQEKNRSGQGKVNEVVVTFAPEYIIEYLSIIYQEYHTEVNNEIEHTEAEIILRNPLDAVITPEELEKIPPERKKVVDTISRTIRERKFRIHISYLYKGLCAICGLQVNLTEAAHIVPVKEDGIDEVTNGVLLCRNHHKAYDSGLLGISEDYTILLNRRYVERLKMIHQDNRLDEFLKESRIGEKIVLPDERRYYPKREYLAQNCMSKRV
jgi:putative restriction endonuclease